MRFHLKNITRLQWGISCIAGLLIAGCLALGEQAANAGHDLGPTFIFKWILVGIVLGVFIGIAQRILETAARSATPIDKNEKTWKARFRLSYTDVLFWALVILVCWTPWIVLMQPTSMGPDTVAQILWFRGYPVWDPSSRQMIEGVTMSDHHPVFDTLIYGLFDQIGLAIGHDSIGYRLYGIVQATITAACMSSLVCFMRERLTAPRGFCIASIAFFALLPPFACMSQVIVKDITSMPFFIVWMLLFCELVLRSKRGEKITIKLIVLLTVMTLLGALTRKTLLYIELLSLVIAFIALRERKTLIAPIVVPSFVLMCLMPMVLFPAFGIAKGGSQEAIAVPLHQTVCAYMQNKDSMSNDDIETIEKVIDLDKAVQVYEIGSADSVKDKAFKRDSTSGDVMRYLLVWAKQAFLYPSSYGDAISYLQAYLYPGQVVSEDFFVRWGWPEFGGNDILRNYPPCTPSDYQPSTENQKLASSFMRESLATIPIVGLLLQSCLYFTWLPIFSLASCLSYKRKYAVLMLSALFITCFTLILCPVAQVRYGYNMLYCAPLLLGIPFLVQDNKTKEHEEETEAEDA